MANVQDVALFFIDLAQQQADDGQGDLMTNLRLQKLLYFAQGWQLARTGKPLFDDEMQKWKHGPVVNDVYQVYKRFGRDGITSDDVIPDDAFSNEEMEVLLDVAREYSRFSTNELVNISHVEGGPWDRASTSRTIPKEEIKGYFESLEPLKKFSDYMADIEVVDPERTADGVAVFPSYIDEGWGDDDDEA